MPTVKLTKELYHRLSRHALGFDQPAHVIERLLNAFENSDNPRLISESSLPTKIEFTNREIQKKIASVAKSLPIEELQSLCSKDTSHEIFNLSFELFRHVPSTSNERLKSAAVEHGGIKRWTWKFQFERDGEIYAICTQWYRKHDIYVYNWLKNHGAI